MLSPLGAAQEYTRSTVKSDGMDVMELPPNELSLLMTIVVTLIPRTVT